MIRPSGAYDPAMQGRPLSIHPLVLCLGAVLATACGSADEEPPPRAPDSLTAVDADLAVLAPTALIEHAEIDESSGIAWTGGAWWTLNDSGGKARLYRSEHLDFADVEELDVPDGVNVDWEELTVLDGDLLACDIGDNGRTRDDLVLYRLRFDADEKKEKERLKLVAEYPVAYPDEPHDAEGVAVIDGAVHIITKDRGEGTLVFRFHDLVEDETNIPVQIGSLELPPKEQVTAADYHPDENLLVLLTYSQILVYPADRLSGAPERSITIHAQQCEALEAVGHLLVFTNEQREVFTVNDFLGRSESAWLPQRDELTLPRSREKAEPMPLHNAAEGETWTWALGEHEALHLSFHLKHGGKVSAVERGGRWYGTGLLIGIGAEDRLRAGPDETVLAIGMDEEGKVVAQRVDLDTREVIGELLAEGVATEEEEGWLSLEIDLPVKAFFLHGIPDEFRFAACGIGLRQGDPPIIGGHNSVSLLRPYAWARVTVPPE
jgi:hypothetical protein